MNSIFSRGGPINKKINEKKYTHQSQKRFVTQYEQALSTHEEVEKLQKAVEDGNLHLYTYTNTHTHRHYTHPRKHTQKLSHTGIHTHTHTH